MNGLLNELKKWPLLFWVGAILTAEHFLAITFWSTERPLIWILGESNQRICWSYFDNCQIIPWNSTSVKILLLSYAILTLCTLILWIRKKPKPAIIGLTLLLIIKAFIILQDYRLGGNYHYIPILLASIFLFLPERRLTLPFGFFLIYFTSGLLKLNRHWLDGHAIQDRLLPRLFTQWGVWYVAVLELIFIFFLFSRNNKLFYVTFFQLVIFHLYSWHLTRFFFPSEMLLLLGILLILRPLYENLAFIEFQRQVFKSHFTKAALVLFIILQLPQYYISGDPVLTGQGRTFALIMYDGRTQCQPYLNIWKRDRTKDELSLIPPWLGTRIKCDPIVYMRLAEKVCEWSQKDTNVLQVDLMLQSRVIQSKEWLPVVSVTDFCNSKINYRSFFPNSWIRPFTTDSRYF